MKQPSPWPAHRAAILANTLRGQGFATAEQTDWTDAPIRPLIYLSRVREGQHQYVSLLSYDSRYLGSVVEIFAFPRNGKAKWTSSKRDRELRGLVPLHVSAPFELADIVAAVDRVYPVSPAESSPPPSRSQRDLARSPDRA